jgi:fibronectin-binding autotransporter adhesin
MSGDAAGLTASILNEGTYNLTTDTVGIGLNSVNVGGSLQLGIADFDNYEGTLAKTGGTGTSHFDASYATTAGTISVSTGTLEFDGSSNTFSSGTISGTGTIAFGAGSSRFSINPTISNFLIDRESVSFGNTLSYAGNFSDTAGSLTLTGNPTFSGTFALSGGAVAFNSGNTLTVPNTTSFAGGTVTGGTIAMNGNTTVAGTTVIQATVVDNGAIAVQGGRFDLGGGVSGNGQITISTGSILELGQATAETQKVSFADNTGTLQIDQPALFKSPISGFERGDTIGVTANSAVYSGGNLTLRNGAVRRRSCN